MCLDYTDFDELKVYTDFYEGQDKVYGKANFLRMIARRIAEEVIYECNIEIE